MTNETHGKLAWGTTILGILAAVIPVLKPPYNLVVGGVLAAIGSGYQATTPAALPTPLNLHTPTPNAAPPQP